MPSTRSAAVYADFVLPHLSASMHLLDVGCGSGELSLELARHVGHLTGVDDDAGELSSARAAASASDVANATFVAGSALGLPAADASFDVAFGHSILEAVERPDHVLAEMRRVLRPGGLVAVASVEYGGLILAGPHPALTRRLFDIRERLWLAEGAVPYRGRELRGLLTAAGFVGVEASARLISFGTADAVAEFGAGRADECVDDWFAEAAQREGLATPGDLAAMRDAWLAWAEAPEAYVAFAWCRALGLRP